jgi:nucleoside-diphosphate-sugar epimerase
MKVSVIGGSGFVGTCFCQRLADRQIAFEIIDISPSQRFADRYRFGDVRDIDTLRHAVTGDIVVLLAAVHRDDVTDKAEYFKTNVIGAENVAIICAEKRIKKIVFTSSVAVYGFAQPITGEDGPIAPFNEYGRTKYQAEEALRKWQGLEGNQLIIVRPTVVFGEGNRGNVFNLLNQIASGMFVMIGSGMNIKSMAYVENVAAFLEKCAETEQSFALYNYTDSPDFDMNTLVRRARKILKDKDSIGPRVPYWVGLFFGILADTFALVSKRKFSISAIRVRKFCAQSSFSSSKAELDDFLAPFSIEEGMNRTLQSEFISPDPKRQIFFSE